MSKSKNKKKNKNIKIQSVLLVVSACILGALIVFLVYKNKKETIVSGEDRTLSGAYPLPAELIDKDKSVFFAYTEIPEFVFKKMNGVSYSDACPVPREDLRYLSVLYWGFDNKAHKGNLIVNRSMADAAVNVFFELYRASYPIESIALVDEFGGNDEVSMAKNNTSCFNCRAATGNGDAWSKHAYGLAIDINPLYNPYIGEDGKVLPVIAKSQGYDNRDKTFPYKIDENDFAYKIFTKYGFSWGGNWENIKDFQHFEYNGQVSE